MPNNRGHQHGFGTPVLVYTDAKFALPACERVSVCLQVSALRLSVSILHELMLPAPEHLRALWTVAKVCNLLGKLCIVQLQACASACCTSTRWSLDKTAVQITDAQTCMCATSLLSTCSQQLP